MAGYAPSRPLREWGHKAAAGSIEADSRPMKNKDGEQMGNGQVYSTFSSDGDTCPMGNACMVASVPFHPTMYLLVHWTWTSKRKPLNHKKLVRGCRWRIRLSLDLGLPRIPTVSLSSFDCNNHLTTRTIRFTLWCAWWSYPHLSGAKRKQNGKGKKQITCMNLGYILNYCLIAIRAAPSTEAQMRRSNSIEHAPN